MEKTLIVLITLFALGCDKPKTYECVAGVERQCVCLNDVIGKQECSKGPAYYNWTARKWIPCSCCWTLYEDDHGPYKIEKNDASGCWTDTYDPATPTYDVGDTDGEDRGSGDG